MAKIKAIIGREESNRRLEIRVENMVAHLGNINTVPQNVSRKHCELTFDTDNGTCRVKDISNGNITYVNGQEVASKTCLLTDSFQLGPSKHTVPLTKICEVATTLAFPSPKPPKPPQPTPNPAPKPTYSISHLEYVWYRYENDVKEVKSAYRKKNLLIDALRMSPFILGSLLALFLGPYAALVGGFLTIVAFILRAKMSPMDDELKKLQDELIDNYKCPNPKCDHFLGYQNFKIIKQNTQCPYCHCNYSDSK